MDFFFFPTRMSNLLELLFIIVSILSVLIGSVVMLSLPFSILVICFLSFLLDHCSWRCTHFTDIFKEPDWVSLIMFSMFWPWKCSSFYVKVFGLSGSASITEIKKNPTTNQGLSRVIRTRYLFPQAWGATFWLSASPFHAPAYSFFFVIFPFHFSKLPLTYN